MSTERRRNRAEPIRNLVVVVDEDRPVDPWPHEQWTDEQWAEHDRKVAEWSANRAARDAEAAERKRWSDLLDAGFPKRSIEAAKSADQNTAAMQRVRSWDPTRESALVLSGSPGCGKTVAATWWAAQQESAPAFLRATTFAASSRYDREERSAWFEARALVLDDLGTEFLDAKGSFLVDLDELLDVFYGDRKPLLITTNCTHEVFRDRYGSRVMDRLRECATWFSASGTSMRKRAP